MSETAIDSRAPQGGDPVAAPPRAEPPRSAAAEPGLLGRHWKTLGIPPTDDVQQLETTFYLMVEKFSRNPTEEDEIQRVELHRAYAVLRRSLLARGPIEVQAVATESVSLTARQKTAAGIAAAISVAGLLYLNFGTLKLGWVRYEPGTVVRLAHESAPYATVIRFDPAHRFQVGGPTRAYELKLAGSEAPVWLSERVVEKGMVPLR
jgi:hypothetical protein